MINFNIQAGESKWHFIWRLYTYQQDTGNLDNEECGEICRRELKEDYDESAYRKVYQYFYKIWKDVECEYLDDDGLESRLDKIAEREDELYKVKVKTFDVIREKRRLLRDDSRIEHLKEYMLECFKDIKEPELIIYKDKLNPDNSKNALLLLSDWHIGLKEENYWNTFNTEVMKQRVQTLLDSTFKYCVANNVKTIYVPSLGDLISGSIHTTTRLFEELDAIDQSTLAAKTIYKLLQSLANYGLSVKYGSVLGNHDRLNKNYKESIEKESFNKIIDWYIEDKINDSDLDIEFITNEIDEGIGMFEIDGDLFPFVHGHKDKVASIINDLSIGLEIHPRAILCAHWHHKVTDTKYKTKLFINGTLSGLDEYNKTRRFWTVPSQTLIILDGKSTIDIDIILD